MPISSSRYSLESFLDGDSYSSLADHRRFTSIDNLLGRIASIIGDGIISGFEIEFLDFPTIKIKSGSAFVKKYYVNIYNDQQISISGSTKFNVFLQRRVGVLSTVGPRSDTRSITYIDGGAPENPQNFICYLESDNPYFKIALSWDSNSEIDFSYYEIQRRKYDNDTFEVISAINNIDTEYYADNTVDEGSLYYYRIFAVDQSGNYGLYSENNISTLLSDALPPNPLDVEFRHSENAINILWKRPAGISYEKIKHWKIEYVQLGSGGDTIEESRNTFIVDKSLYNDRIEGLENGEIYKVSIYTVDVHSRESSGMVAHVSPQPSPAAQDPQSIDYNETQGPSGTRINLSWIDGTSEYDNTLSYRYNIYVKVDDQQQESLAINVPIGFTSEQIDLYTFDLIHYNSIPQNKLITLRVTSVTSEGYESFGNYIRFTTKLFTVPAIVRNVNSVFDANNGIIDVFWEYDSHTNYIKIYIIDEDLNDEYLSDYVLVDENIGLTNRYSFSVKLDHRYTIRITPYNFEDESGSTNSISILTLVQGGFPLPSIPRDLLTQGGDRQIKVTWQPSTSLSTRFYNIYRKNGRVSFSPNDWEIIDTLPSSTYSFTDYGLENNSIWSYYITSVDVYGRESQHLTDRAINLNYVEIIPRKSGILTNPDIIDINLSGNDITLIWDSLLEEFDAYVIYRSKNNLHSWEIIATLDKNSTTYIDENIALIDQHKYYYSIEKIINDADIVVQSSDDFPDNSIIIGTVYLSGNSFESVDTSKRLIVKDIYSYLDEETSSRVLTHLHKEIDYFDSTRIDLSNKIVITNWATVDGKIFTTNEPDISGTGHLLRVNDRFPSVLFSIDTENRRIIFSEPIVEFDSDSESIITNIPKIELTILGIEEVTNILSSSYINYLHAKQIQFGNIKEEQIPSIGHDGRIKEKIIPKTYYLERFSNHSFIVPQNTQDETKTFGNGTAFYAVIDHSGLIEKVTSFSEEDDGSLYCFQKPSYSAITFSNIKTDIDICEIYSEQNPPNETKSLNVQFEFVDTKQTRWVHLTTFNGETLPNPVLNLKKKVRFKILNETSPFYMSLGIREISIRPDVASNGGTSGAIEWVGSEEVISDDSGNVAPVGKLINVIEGEWQEIEFDLPKENCISFEGGNGILSTEYGTLEHIALTINGDESPLDTKINIYISNIEQFSDVLVSGTSQGILVSNDFGSSWALSRLTETPIHKFYKATYNKYTWAISSNQVFLSTNSDTWFATSGTTGIQFIRDIVEDSQGNMYISTDKGVYWFQISTIDHFSSWRQTSNVNAFTTDCYALYFNSYISGVDEIWVSTEIGVYKTLDRGQTWIDSGIDTAGTYAYQIISVNGMKFAITNKHILRQENNGDQFQTICNLYEQHGIKNIWSMEYFNGNVYVSTENGIYSNTTQDLFIPYITHIYFDKVFPQLDINGFVLSTFCLNKVQITSQEDQLFIGQENRLLSFTQVNSLHIKKQYINKEVPSFYIKKEEILTGYIYSAFNNVLIFRDPQSVNSIIESAYLPRKKYIAYHEGWAQSNIKADVFIHLNGLPKWIDFKTNDENIITELQSSKESILSIKNKLSSFNSLIPKSLEIVDQCISNIDFILQGGDNNSVNITTSSISDFVDNYTRLQSLVTSLFLTQNDLSSMPEIKLIGFPKQNRLENSRSDILEQTEDILSSDSTGIIINTVNGEIDFLTVYTNSTDQDRRLEFTFNKYDDLKISIFNANVKNTGENTHSFIEYHFEKLNSGLTSGMVRGQSSNLISLGIFLEKQNNYLFTRFPVQNVQSKFYNAYTNVWYDIQNSTIDYIKICGVNQSVQSDYCTSILHTNNDPYYGSVIWIGTNYGLHKARIENNNIVIFESLFLDNNFSVLDIYENEGTIYVVLEDNDLDISLLYTTDNYGNTWNKKDTINLPSHFYKINIINGCKICSTDYGIFYSDNDFDTWYQASAFNTNGTNIGESIDQFSNRILNLYSSVFSICESSGWFFISSTGREWTSLKNRMTLNNIKLINKIHRFKNITWIATDKGMYNDSNSILSDSISYGLLSDMTGSITESINLHISDVDSHEDFLFCSVDNIVYRYYNNEWKHHEIESLESGIHKIKSVLDGSKLLLVCFSYDQIRVIDVTEGTGVFN